MANKNIRVPYGIPGHNLKTITRYVSSDEPDGWPVNDDLKVVGKRIKRTDAKAKVMGAAKYTSDKNLAGMLYGGMLRSPLPSARIKSIDISKAEKYPGVYAVHVLERDVNMAQPQDSGDGNKYPDIKYAGQPIAGVAARDMRTVKEALNLINVVYDERPFVVALEEAMKDGAPAVFEGDVEQEDSGGGGGGAAGLKTIGNLRGPSTGSFYGGPRGDVENGFSQADIVLERTYRTQVHTHCSLETHGVVVDWKPDKVIVYASTQNTTNVRDEFSEHFDIPRSKVRVVCEFMGGGFGAKHSLGNFGVMAGNLAKKTGRPVKLMLDRKEEHISAGNRPNSIHYLKVGAKNDGRLISIKQKSYGTAGVGLGAGVGRVAQALYNSDNFLTEQWDVFTNAGPGAAWRAPGNVQGAWGLEQMIDELSEKLDMDPIKLRDKVDGSEIRKVERIRGAEKFGWNRRKKPGSDKGPVKKGMGIAQGHWSRFTNLNSTVEIRAFKDGAIEVRSAVQDIGTGTKTVLAQVVAEELGIQPEEISIRIGDTLFPDAPGSGGSVVTGSITPPARNAAYKIKKEIFKVAATQLGASEYQMDMKDGKVMVKNNPSKSITLKEALGGMPTGQIMASASRSDDYGGFKSGKWLSKGELGSVQFAEVSVDTETGFIKVDRVVAAHSCGRPLNIAQVESQINGGVIQGVAYALYENRIMDNETGHQINPNLDQYRIPYSFEVPVIEPVIVEEYPANTSTDAFGIGEPANIATAAAVANAVYNAIGVRIFDAPITPDKVLKALNKA